MRTKRQYWAIYAVLFVALIGLVVLPNAIGVYRAAEADDVRYLEGVPVWSMDRIRAEMAWLESQQPGDTPEQYHAYLARVFALPAICTKQLRSGMHAVGAGYPHASTASESESILRRCEMVSGGMGPITQLQQSYERKFGLRTMQQTADRLRSGDNTLLQPYPRPAATPTWQFYWHMYLGSLLLALFFFVVRLKHEELNVWPEVVRIWPLPVATVLWPYRMWKYPTGTLAGQAVAARTAVMRFATAAASAALSLFAGGMASAQSKSPDNSKKDPKARWTLTNDLRFSVPAAGASPDPNGFLRLTLTSPGGKLLESVTTERPGFWNTSLVAGAPLVSRPGLSVYAVGGGIANSAGGLSAQAGFQVYAVGKRFYQFAPVIAVERAVRPAPLTTFAYAGQTGVVLSPDWRLGADVVLRFPDGRPMYASLGTHLARKVGPGFLEAAVLHDSNDVTTARVRWVRNATPVVAGGPSGWSTTLYGGYASKYVGVLGMAIHDHTVLRQGVTLTHRSGVYLDLWNSISPDGFNNNWGDETDITIGRSGSIGPLALNAGLIHFMVYPLDEMRGDMRDVFMDTTLKHRLSPFLRLDWVLGRDPEINEGGLAWRTGIRPSFTIGRPFTLEVSAAGHDGLVSTPPERVSSVRAVLKTAFQAGKLRLAPYAGHQRTTRTGGIAPTRTWFGLDLAYSF